MFVLTGGTDSDHYFEALKHRHTTGNVAILIIILLDTSFDNTCTYCHIFLTCKSLRGALAVWECIQFRLRRDRIVECACAWLRFSHAAGLVLCVAPIQCRTENIR
jgi:hypothetical protein